MGNITVIQTIQNNYGDTIQFVNTESNGNNRAVPSGGSAQDGAWVPWCDSSAQFPIHHLSVSAPGKIYYIYQSGANVWGTSVGFQNNATNLGNQGGTYTLTISANFDITLS